VNCLTATAHCKRIATRVRLPLGCINGEWPVLVSDVWSGRSLNVGCPSDNATREKVQRAARGANLARRSTRSPRKASIYVDLHAGNVMVDEALENAWLIDFEGAVAAAEVAGSPTQVAEEQLRAALDAQKADLLKRFEVIDCQKKLVRVRCVSPLKSNQITYTNLHSS
jgi:hypothetical protein